MIVKKYISIFLRFCFCNLVFKLSIFCKIETFTPLYKLFQMKDDKERNYFSLRIMFQKCLFPMLKCVWKRHHKKWTFLMAKSVQKNYTLNCSHKCPCTFHTVRHYYAVSFSRKTILRETNNIFYSLRNQKLDKAKS